MALECVHIFLAIFSLAVLQVFARPHNGPEATGSRSPGSSNFNPVFSPSDELGPGKIYEHYALSPSEKKSANILIAHAVLAVLVWAFFAPAGAIILRLNVQAPLVKLHGWILFTSYITYIIAAGMGVWLAIQANKYKPTWTDPHPIIGLVILGAALFQPFLGLIHHDIFSTQFMRWKADRAKQKPGRTIFALIHLWIGRILITLGIINGGLGIKLAAGSPFQNAKTTGNAYVAYGILAGLMWILFACVSALFAYRRTARIRREKREEKARYATKQATPETGSEEEFKI